MLIMRLIIRANYSENISWGIIDEEVFVFDEMSRNIYLFRGLEKEIWLLLENHKKIDNINVLRYNHNIEDIIHFIERLVKWNLIKMECGYEE